MLPYFKIKKYIIYGPYWTICNSS